MVHHRSRREVSLTLVLFAGCSCSYIVPPAVEQTGGAAVQESTEPYKDRTPLARESFSLLDTELESIVAEVRKKVRTEKELPDRITLEVVNLDREVPTSLDGIKIDGKKWVEGSVGLVLEVLRSDERFVDVGLTIAYPVAGGQYLQLAFRRSDGRLEYYKTLGGCMLL